MGAGFSIIRAFARLNALGAVTGAAILLIICCISTPVFKQFTFSDVTFGDGSHLELGMWGYCYTNFQGVQNCPPTSFGYNFNATGLGRYAVNPGPSDLWVVQKSLSSAFIFFPLAVGSLLLTALLALLPFRIVTLMAIATCFLSVGASAIAAVLGLVAFTQANSRLGLMFNPNDFVHPKLGKCVWFALAAMVAAVGALLFLLIALPPKRHDPPPPEAIYDREKYAGTGTNYADRRESERYHGRNAGIGSTGLGAAGYADPAYSTRNTSRRTATVYDDDGDDMYERRSKRSSARNRVLEPALIAGDDGRSSRRSIRDSRTSRRDSESQRAPDDDDRSDGTELAEERRSSRVPARDVKRRTRQDDDEDDGRGYIGY